MTQHDLPPENTPPARHPPVQNHPLVVHMQVKEPRLVYILLAINVLVFMYSFSFSPTQHYQFLYNWGKVNELIKEGEIYRLLTAMFLHIDPSHIAFNGLALYIYGRSTEMLLGRTRFIIIYFLGGLSASLASFVFTDALSVGASGAIFAIFGAEFVYFYIHRDLHGPTVRPYLTRLVFFMVINLSIGFIPRSDFQIDNAGHIGGLVGGVILAWFIGPAYRVIPNLVERKLAVVDENPLQKGIPLALLYAAGLIVVLWYAMSA